MEILVTCLNAILPIVLLMAVGYFCQRVGLIGRDDVPRFNRVAFHVFLSSLIFNSIYTSDIDDTFNPRLMAYAFLAVLVAFSLSAAWVHRHVAEERQRGVMIQGMYRSNFAILGFTLATGFVESSQLGSVAMLTAVVIPEFNVLAVITLTIHGGKSSGWKATAINVAKNPLIIATVLALAFAIPGIRLPGVIETTVSMAAQVATPLMLFLLGAFFRFESVPRYRKQLSIVCLVRLVLVPAVVLSVGAALGFRGVEMVALITASGSPTAVGSFTMTQQMGGDDELAGNIVAVTSVICPLTLFAWCSLFMHLGII